MKIKKTFLICATLSFVIMGLVLSIPIYASGNISLDFAAQEEIDRIVQEELSKAKTPKAVVSAIQGEDTAYFSHSGKDSEPAPDTRSLFQIGSLTKAYTGLGILLLEDDGLLSLNDPVSKYLPWFTVSYNGKTVPPETLTIADLLYQTSGFTNDERRYPNASSGVTLEDSVRQINGSELECYPSQQFDYSNINYRILGLIIEVVSGQSYDKFMTNHILLPLGLESTYTDPQKAKNTGLVVEGSRLSFLRVWPYDVPTADGNIPAGFIYSNIEDMSRWLQMQMGEIEVSEQFQRILERSHQPNQRSVVDELTHYAAGWFIDDETGEIYHSGGTPSYSTKAAIRPQSNIAVCVLTNMNASVNTGNIAANTLNILESKPVIAYQADIWNILDLIFSGITIASIIGTALIIFLTFRLVKQIRKGLRKKIRLTRRRMTIFIPSLLLILFTMSVAIIFPAAFGSSWIGLGVWAPLSLLSGMVFLIALSLCSLGFSFISACCMKQSHESLEPVRMDCEIAQK